MEFASPATASGASFKPSEHLGSLLVIEPIAVELELPTVNGPSDAVRANVTVLDGDRAGEHMPDALIWGKVLRSQLSSKIGQKVLGRLTQGTAKPGQSAPWQLSDATADDLTAAKKWASGASAATNAAAPF